MTDYFKNRPMLLCGICISILCIVGARVPAVAFIAAAALFVALVVLLFRKKKRPVLLFGIVMILAASVSLPLTVARTEEAEQAVDGRAVEARLIVTDQPKDYDTYRSAVFEVVSCCGLRRGTKLFLFTKDYDFEMGDAVTATVTLRTIEETYKMRDYADGISLAGTATGLTVLPDGDAVLKTVNRVRGYIKDTLFANMGYQEAATLTAVVLGDRSYFSDEFSGKIANAGVSHIMVVSGMHLAVIIALVTRLGEKLFYNRCLRALLIFVTALFVAALCGFGKSIIRAGLCCVLCAVGAALGRENTPENTLGGAVSLILIAEPFAVYSISFQLSVLSTLGITAVAIPIKRFLEKKQAFRSKAAFGIVTSLIVTFSALLFTMPIVTAIFGSISPIAPITNLLLGCVMTAALSLAAIGLMLNFFLPFLAKPILSAAGVVAAYINFIIDEFGSLPFASVKCGRMAPVFATLLFILVIAGLFACKKRAERSKLKAIDQKRIREGGAKLKWRL